MRIITSHENTDFDALAAMLAASKLYPDAIPVLPRRLNRNLRDFLALYGGEFPFTEADDLPRRRITHVVLVDTQSMSPIKGTNDRTRIRIIDHHPLRIEPGPTVSFSGEELGASTTLLIEQLQERGTVLTPFETTLLLLGIYEDTGSLSYDTTTSRDIRAAAWLLDRGASLEVVNDFLRRSLTEQQQSLYKKLVDQSTTHHFQGQTVLVAAVELEEYVEELSTLVHKLNDLFDPDAVFLLAGLGSSLQLIARSTTDAVDVAEIARHFGGGGHSKASAALIEDKGVEEAREELLTLLTECVHPLTTVREIMSRRVHTLTPGTTVEEARGLIRRYGHEGFPVVEDGKLMGVLTRREVDRAIHHELGHVPVQVYMHKGSASVSPADSVSDVQRVMIEHGLGQVPVVEDGRFTGIVTRTDLIKAWARPPSLSQASDVRQRMGNVFPAPLRSLLFKASDVATELGFSLYLVGGFVRDLLLDTPTLDLDLVIEGDAIRFARHLSKVIGGHVHSHTRFGTAKIILGGTAGTTLPASLDFVTARTEFYEHPTALPEIERSSIKQDLYRRDFTINTMAICLNRDRYGELLDFYGGQKDLQEKLIRVLHNLSFVEDPTRMLRAARLEQRLGFRIEERTAELIDDARELLARVTGERLRHELYLILQEDAPELVLRRMAELGILRTIHPALSYDEWLHKSFIQLRVAEELSRTVERTAHFSAAELLPPGTDAELGRRNGRPTPAQYLALVCFRLSEEEVASFVQRLKLRGSEAQTIRRTSELRSRLPELSNPKLSPSSIYRVLHPSAVAVLAALRVATDSKVARRNIDLYARKLRHIKSIIDGHYLQRMGIPTGPLYREILQQLRDARMDGRIVTIAEEETLIQELLAEKNLTIHGNDRDGELQSPDHSG